MELCITNHLIKPLHSVIDEVLVICVYLDLLREARLLPGTHPGFRDAPELALGIQQMDDGSLQTWSR